MISVKTYKIGDFCKKVGVSANFLKYQEEHGLITPYLKEYSDYRYYCLEHAGRVYETLMYKNLCFTSREIKQLFSKKTSDEIMNMFSDKSAKTRAQIGRLQHHLEFMDMVTKCRRCETRPNPWYICELEGHFYLPHFRRDDFLSDERTLAYIKDWIFWSPMVHSTQRVILGGASDRIRIDDDTDYCWGFIVPEKFAREVGLPTGDPVIYIPPQRCLLYYQNVEVPLSPERSSRGMLKSCYHTGVEATMKQCGFKAAGDIYNVTLFYSYEDGVRRIHTQLIIPLED